MVMDLTKNQPKEKKKEMSFEKVIKIGIIDKGYKGSTVELNKVSYNGKDPVYDLRKWTEEGTKMGKGITLTDQTLENLLILLKYHLEGIFPEEEKEETNESDITAHIPDDF